MRQPITFTAEEIKSIAQYCDIFVDQKLTFVNKKYGETITEMTTIPYVHLNNTYDINQCKSIKQSFKVFDKAEECCLYSTFLTQFNEFGCVEYMFTEQFQQMQQIHLIGLPEAQEAIYMLQEAITKITTPICYYDDLDLSEYPNIKELTLDFEDDAFDFKSLFSNLFEPLDVLRIKNFSDNEMLVNCIGRGHVARKIYIYTKNGNSDDENIKKLTSLKHCKVVVDNKQYEIKNMSFDYSEDNMYNYTEDEYNVEIDYSDDECQFYNDDFLYYQESKEEENNYHCVISNETDDNIEKFLCQYSSDSIDNDQTFITKVYLTTSMSENDSINDGYYLQHSPCFVPSQLE